MLVKKIDFILSPQDVENFENNLGFISPHLVKFIVLQDLNEIHFDVSHEQFNEEVFAKIDLLIKKLRPAKEVRIKKYFDHLDIVPFFENDILKVLEEEKQIFRHASGFYSLRGVPAKMMLSLEQKLIEFSKTFQAEEVSLPISTSISDLKQAHFFKRTPQHANFISLLKDDCEVISNFSGLIEKESLEIYQHFKAPTHICRSAVCSNSYPQFKDTILGPSDYLTWTTFGRAFRNESQMVHGLERLYEFSMREMIFFGDKEFVSDGLLKCMEWFKNFLIEFNIKGVIQSAGDPFYADNARALQFYQAAEESKYEFRLVNPYSNKEISCGSINNHGGHFSKSYNIKLASGDYATTGCVGFGYERLIFCVLSQMGLNFDKWPMNLKSFFNL